MKLLYEKNLTSVVAAFKKDEKYFCGNCAKEIEKTDKICARCKSRIDYLGWEKLSKVSYCTRITASEKDDKILINVFQGSTSLINGKFYFQKHICPFAFNFKTGQSYKLPILNGETKKPLRIKGNGIKNISYAPCEIPSEAVSAEAEGEIKRIFLSKARRYVHYADEIKRFYTSNYNDVRNYMLSLVKFKYCDEATESVVNSQYAKRDLKPARKYWLKPKARENIQKALAAHYPLNIWKSFENDFKLFSKMYKIGYLKPDNQRKLMQEVLSLQELNKHSCRISVGSINSFVDLIQLSDNENEMVRRVCKMMLSNPRTSEWTIMDAADMLKKAKDGGMEIKDILKMRTFDEIHDAAEDLYYELKRENKIIKISPKEEALNHTDGDYKFTVCTETHQLTAIGNAMHICVGSYDDRAVNKECLIVKGEINNKLFTCIEVINKRLVQVKGYCNKLLNEEDRKVVIKWAEEKDLNYKNCFDLKEQLRRPEDEEPEVELIPIEELMENGELIIPDEDEETPAREPDIAEDEELDDDFWLPF